MKQLKYYQFILGCQMNKSDAERLAGLLEALGFKRTLREKEANLICVQACSVRQSAVDRIKGRILGWRAGQKRRGTENPLVTLLTGCVLPVDRKIFEKQFDLVLETDELGRKLARHLNGLFNNNTVVRNGAEITFDDDFFVLKPKYTSKFQAYVLIQTGCNNFCTYCAVPYTKGRECYRPHKDIVQEVQNLVKNGYKEITLLGQNVNTYYDQGKSDKSRVKSTSQKSRIKSGIVDFSCLLRLLNDILGNFWVRFVSSNPWDMSEETIKAVADCEKICEYIHLPLQSGSDRVLKRMNRRYASKDYLELVGQLRSTIPDVAITTDLIVGFPGETEKDFRETALVMEKVKFDMAYIARYSPRPGTVAASYFKDDVPLAEKKRREKHLERILRQSTLERNKEYVGRTVEVLVGKFKAQNSDVKTTTRNSKLKLLLGKTRTFKTIEFWGEENLIGQFVEVRITGAREFGLEGELLEIG